MHPRLCVWQPCLSSDWLAAISRILTPQPGYHSASKNVPPKDCPIVHRETCPIGFAELVRQLQAGSQSAIHAVMEEPAPNALNGKQSWYGCGYAYGTCKGVLSALGVPLHTVTGRLWKSHLALNGLGKEGSRSMALNMLPQAAKLIRFAPPPPPSLPFPGAGNSPSDLSQ